MNIEKLLSRYISAVSEAINRIRPIIFEGEGKEIIATKTEGDVTRRMDVIVEDFIKNETISLGIPVRFISEECGILDLSPSPDFILFLDPIDGTDMAIRGYPLCSISLSLHDIDTMKTMLAVIGDIFQKKIYYASKKGAFFKKQNKITPLKPSTVRKIDDAMIVSYAAKSYRLLSLLDQKKLLSKVKLFFNYGGPLDIARVGEGTVDAFIEFEKGFKVIDYSAGIFIAKMAGAVATDLNGLEINLPRELNSRQKFLVSCCEELHKEILNCLDLEEKIL